MTTKQLATRKANTQINETDGVILSNIKNEFNDNMKSFKFEVFDSYLSPGVVRDVTRSAQDVLGNVLKSLGSYWPESIFTIDYNALRTKLVQTSYVPVTTKEDVGWQLTADGFCNIASEAILHNPHDGFPPHISGLLFPDILKTFDESFKSGFFRNDYIVFKPSGKPDGVVRVSHSHKSFYEVTNYGYNISLRFLLKPWECPFKKPIIVIDKDVFDDKAINLFDRYTRGDTYTTNVGPFQPGYVSDLTGTSLNIPLISSFIGNLSWYKIQDRTPHDIITVNWNSLDDYQKVLIAIGIRYFDIGDEYFRINTLQDYSAQAVRNFIFVRGKESRWRFTLNENKIPSFSFYQGDTTLWSDTNVKFAVQGPSRQPDTSTIEAFDTVDEVGDAIEFFNHLDKDELLNNTADSVKTLIHNDHQTVRSVISDLVESGEHLPFTFGGSEVTRITNIVLTKPEQSMPKLVTNDIDGFIALFPEANLSASEVLKVKTLVVNRVQAYHRIKAALDSKVRSIYNTKLLNWFISTDRINDIYDIEFFISNYCDKYVSIINTLMAFNLGEMTIPKFSTGELEIILSDENSIMFHNLKKIHMVYDFAQSKAINNVISIFEEFSQHLQSMSDLSFNNLHDINSIKTKYQQLIADYEKSFDDLDDEASASDYEKIVADFRNDGRPHFDNSFDDILLSVKSYIVELRAWLYRKVADSQIIMSFIEKLSGFINKIKISIDFPDFNTITDFIGAVIKTGLTKTLSSVSNGLAVIDDVADFIAKTRLPISINKNVAPLRSYTSGRVTALGKDNVTLIFDGKGQHSKVFVPDFTGKKFGDFFWTVRETLPIFTSSKLFTNPKRYRNINPVNEGSTNGWVFDMDPILKDEYKPYMKNLSNIAKRYPYLAYASFFMNRDVNFSPMLTRSELGVMWATVTAQAGLAGAVASIKSPGVITRLVAGVIAMAAVIANNTVAYIRWTNQFPESSSTMLTREKYLPDESAEFISMPFSAVMFHPWSKLKWILESGKFAASMSIALAGSVAIGNAIGSVSKKIRSAIRKRTVKKAYFKPVLEEKCLPDKAGNTVCKMVKVKNPQRFTTLPNGEKVKLTRSEVYEKIAFDTFIEVKKPKAGGSLSNVLKSVQTQGEMLSSSAVAAKTAQAGIDNIKEIVDKITGVKKNVTILNKSLGLKHFD